MSTVEPPIKYAMPVEGLMLDPLVEALARASQDMIARADFYKCLLESPVYVLGERSEQGVNLQYWQEQESGQDIVPFFSSLYLLEQAIEEPSAFLKLTGRELFRLSGSAPLILNPFSQLSTAFPPNEVEMLRLEAVASVLIDGHLSVTNTVISPVHIEEEGQPVQPSQPLAHLLVGVPAALPENFSRELADRLSPHDDIRSAYVVQYYYPDMTNAEPRILVALELEEVDECLPRITPTFAERLAERLSALPPNPAIDVAWLSDDHPLNDYILNELTPVYRKGILGKIINMFNK